MLKTIDVTAPDGWICLIEDSGNGRFFPRFWKRSIETANVVGSEPTDPSQAIQAHLFYSATEAMLAAYRERLQRNVGAGQPRSRN